MFLSMSMTQRIVLTQSQFIPMAPTNWSPVDVVTTGGGLALLPSIKLGLDGMSHEERLAAIDEANRDFRYDYGFQEVCNDRYEDGRKKILYRVPLMRDFNVDREKIRERISRKEYERIRHLFEEAGPLQRIARAVPYGDIYRRIKERVEGEGHTLDKVVLVGVDRGGRIPALLARAAIGHSRAYFLKVDQGDGETRGGPDVARLMLLAGNGVFRDRFVVFVDSTVDSGRQIRHLERWFDDAGKREELGHAGWVVAGSNEHGQTLEHHVNINWGVDPDRTFEDDVRLLGMDYEDRGDMTHVIPIPSPEATAIRQAFMSVPKGFVFDISDESVLRAQRVREYVKLAKAVASGDAHLREWNRAGRASVWRRNRPNLDVSELAERPSGPGSKMRKLAVIGSHAESDLDQLSELQAKHLARSLAAQYEFQVGSLRGLPGLFAKTARSDADFSRVRVFQRDRAEVPDPSMEVKVTMGSSKEANRLALIDESDVVLVLPGGSGTLMEALIALAMGKQVVTIRGYGRVARYLERHRMHKKAPNLHVADSLTDAIALLKGVGEKAGEKI